MDTSTSITFTCSKCGLEKPVQKNGGTGYACDSTGTVKTCYICVADIDRQTMIETGNSRNLPLYLSGGKVAGMAGNGDWKVSNWPDTLQFKPLAVRTGHHNIARTRTDVWFIGPDGHVWHGATFGEWTQILHAKRTKELIRAVRSI